LTKAEREELITLKIEARKREDWATCKVLRNAIFEYDRQHPNEKPLSLEVAQATHGI
jgi:hypothetical protein